MCLVDKIPQYNPAPTKDEIVNKNNNELKLIIQLLIEEIKIIKAGD